MSQAATAGPAPRVAEAPVRSRRISRALLRPILMLGGILVVAVGVRRLLAHRRALRLDRRRLCARREGDDRRPTCPGIVASVPVHEGQRVKKGDVLLRLDPRQFQIMLDAARANLNGIVTGAERHEARLSAHAARRRCEAVAGAVRPGELRALFQPGEVGRRHPCRLRQHALPARRQPAGGDGAEDHGARCSSPGCGAIRTSMSRTMPDYLQAKARRGRGAAPARPRGDLRAVRRRRDAGGYRAARHVPRRFHRGVRHRLHRRRLDRGQSEGDRTHLGEAGRSGLGDGRYLSRPPAGRAWWRASRPTPVRSSRCCRRRTPRATG